MKTLEGRYVTTDKLLKQNSCEGHPPKYTDTLSVSLSKHLHKCIDISVVVWLYLPPSSEWPVNRDRVSFIFTSLAMPLTVWNCATRITTPLRPLKSRRPRSRKLTFRDFICTWEDRTFMFIHAQTHTLNARPCRGRWPKKRDVLSWAFPGGPVVKTLGFHCRGHRFNPWSGN